MRNKEWPLGFRLVHWGMALLVVCIVVLGWLAVEQPMSLAKIKLFLWHKSLGLTVLALFLIRLTWRLRIDAPGTGSRTDQIEKSRAKWVHATLYLLMLMMPVSGWVINSAANFPLKWFGLFAVPSITSPSESLELLAKDVHWVLFWIFAVLLVLHVAAALRHHYVHRNKVLMRMLSLKQTEI